MQVATPALSPALPVRLAKTALWVHLLALLFLGVGIGAFVLRRKGDQDSWVILGVGGAAWLVLTVWSIALSFRSKMRGEGTGWRTALWMSMLLEASVVLILLWVFDYQSWDVLESMELVRGAFDTLFAFCLPVLVPFLFVSLCVAWPLSKWLSGRYRRRWYWVPAIIAIQAVLILPWILFPYCVQHLRFEIAGLTPHFIADCEEALLQPNSISNSDLKGRILTGGFVSRERLLERMYDSNPTVVSTSCWGFQVKCPDEALARCLEFSHSSRSISIWRRNPADARAFGFGEFVAAKANKAQIRQLLDQHDPMAATFYFVLFRSIEQRPQIEYLPDIMRLAAADPNACSLLRDFDWRFDPARREVQFGDVSDAARKEAMRKAAVREEAVRKAWMKLFEKRDWPDRDGLADEAVYLDNTELIACCLDDSSVKMRRRAIHALAVNGTGIEERTFLKFFDDPDIVVRRAMVHLFHQLSTIPIKLTPDESSSMTTENFTPAPPVPGEEKELETVRAAFEKWLKDHER